VNSRPTSPPQNWKLSEQGANLPVMMRHGDDDEVVALWMAEKSLAAVENAGLTNKVEFKTYPMGHSATMEEIEDVMQWVRKIMQA
jgi:predicted esterase